MCAEAGYGLGLFLRIRTGRRLMRRFACDGEKAGDPTKRRERSCLESLDVLREHFRAERQLENDGAQQLKPRHHLRDALRGDAGGKL